MAAWLFLAPVVVMVCLAQPAAQGRRPAQTRADPRIKGLSWALIPPGTFQMGCTQGDTECNDDELPRHAVTLTRAFELMTTEVTVAMARATGLDLYRQPDGSRDDDPAVGLPWDHARDVCRVLGGRLPTEAEWEYAARGALSGRYPWGNDAPVCAGGRPNGARFDDEAACAAQKEATRGRTRVASYAANGYGLYDMAGNATEWVADFHGPYGSGPRTDPRGAPSGSYRVWRGGDYSAIPISLRVSSRVAALPLGALDSSGVRCARDVPR